MARVVGRQPVETAAEPLHTSPQIGTGRVPVGGPLQIEQPEMRGTESCGAIEVGMSKPAQSSHGDVIVAETVPLRHWWRVQVTVLAVAGLLLAPYVAPLHAALSDNLVAFWSLDNTLTEEVSGYTLTNNNATPLNGTGHVYTNAADFENGGGPFTLTRADNADISSCDCDFTIAMWVNLETAPTALFEIAGAGEAGGFAWRFGSQASGVFRFRVSSATGEANATNVDTVATHTNGMWYLVIGWHDAANDQIGIAASSDGLTARTAAYSAGVWDSAGLFTIGAGNTNYFPTYFDGLIGPVMMWKQVLDSTERAALFDAGSGITYAEIIGGGGGGSCPSTLALLGVGC